MNFDHYVNDPGPGIAFDTNTPASFTWGYDGGRRESHRG